MSKLRAERRGFDSRQGQGFPFSLRHLVQTGFGAHPVSYLIRDHSPPSSAEVNGVVLS